jgi:hypothetical protein
VATRAEGLIAMVIANRTEVQRPDTHYEQPSKAWWFNPRNVNEAAIGEFANTGTREFNPDTGET